MRKSATLLQNAIDIWTKKANFFASWVRRCDSLSEMDQIWQLQSFALNKVIELELELSKFETIFVSNDVNLLFYMPTDSSFPSTACAGAIGLALGC